ncbi:interleukin 17a/f3 [Notolabrus celidotus]|uniref:interleukin 17a/f3 n=1 Tax=Notolabrus celidotus TaxID=1203425 RepID=UPI00148FE155|nr:interleukin 17a/f3 [Notolabrus celidotus]
MLMVLRAVLLLSLFTLFHARKDKAVRGGQKKRKNVRLVLDPSVLSHVGSVSHSTMANMSLTPWTYRDSSEASRLPTRISQAQCLTSGCLSLQGGGEDLALMATPIYYQALVLHKVHQPRLNGRKKAKKRHHFRLGTEMIAVGCTCVRPILVPQQ